VRAVHHDVAALTAARGKLRGLVDLRGRRRHAVPAGQEEVLRRRVHAALRELGRQVDGRRPLLLELAAVPPTDPPARNHLGRHRRAVRHGVLRVQVRVEPCREVEAPEQDVRPAWYEPRPVTLAQHPHSHAQQEAGGDDHLQGRAVPERRPEQEALHVVDRARRRRAGDAAGHVLEVHAVDRAHGGGLEDR